MKKLRSMNSSVIKYGIIVISVFFVLVSCSSIQRANLSEEEKEKIRTIRHAKAEQVQKKKSDEEIFLDYQPKVLAKDSDVKDIIKVTLLDQPPEYTFHDVEVTDSYFKAIRYATKGTPFLTDVTSVQSTVVVRFRNVSEIRKDIGRRYYLVDIYDRAMSLKVRVYIATPSLAMEFLDALYTMIMREQE